MRVLRPGPVLVVLLAAPLCAEQQEVYHHCNRCKAVAGTSGRDLRPWEHKSSCLYYRPRGGGRPVPVQPKESPADAAFRRAYKLGQAGKRMEAIAAYREVLRLEPAHAAAWNNLANLYWKLRRYRDAEKAYRRALTLSPDSKKYRDNYRRFARACEDRGDYNAAGAALMWLDTDGKPEGLLKILPRLSPAQLRVRCPNFTAFRERRSEKAKSAHEQGKQFEARGRLVDAERAFAEAVRIEPRNDTYRRALDAIRGALRREQSTSELLARARGLADTNRHREAIARYQEALRWGSLDKQEQASIWYQIAAQHEKLDDLDGIESACGRALALGGDAPEHDERALQLRFNWCERSRWDEVAARAGQVLQRHPGDYRFHVLRGYAFVKADKAKTLDDARADAARSFHEALRAHQPGVDHHGNGFVAIDLAIDALADVYEVSNQPYAARRVYERGILLDPRNAERYRSRILALRTKAPPIPEPGPDFQELALRSPRVPRRPRREVAWLRIAHDTSNVGYAEPLRDASRRARQRLDEKVRNRAKDHLIALASLPGLPGSKSRKKIIEIEVEVHETTVSVFEDLLDRMGEHFIEHEQELVDRIGKAWKTLLQLSGETAASVWFDGS